MSYPNCMDHLEVLREKIGRLRAEIADIHQLNEQYLRRDRNERDGEIAHGQRHVDTNKLSGGRQTTAQLREQFRRFPGCVKLASAQRLLLACGTAPDTQRQIDLIRYPALSSTF